MISKLKYSQLLYVSIVLILLVVYTNFFIGIKLSLLLLIVFALYPKKIIPLFDFNIFLIFLFSFSYFLNKNLNIEYTISFYKEIEILFYPIIGYITGKYVIKYLGVQNKNIFYFHMLISIFYMLVPVVSIFIQLSNITYVDGERSMYLIYNPTYFISATVFGQFFFISSLLLPFSFLSFRNKYINMCLILIYILSLLSVLRLGNRTQLVLSLLSIFICLFYKYKFVDQKRNILIGTIILIGCFIVSKVDLNSDYFYYYQDRMNNSSSSIENAGGRTDKWINSLNLVLEHPFGWNLSLNGYSHNLWLDSARVGGIFSFVFLIIITMILLYNFIKLSSKKMSSFVYLFFLVLFISIHLYLSVEPIIDGMPLIFFYYFIFFGNIVEARKTLKHNR